MLYRKFEDELIKWFKTTNKKALLIDGARQIGKTTLVRNFAKKMYKEPIVEINFITTPSAKDIFKGDLTAQSIIDKITLFIGRSLIPKETLIFFDEVQECAEVRTAMKFLIEDGSFDYIESGFLFGINYSKTTSYSVGFEQVKTMYPMDFEEFVIANNVPKNIIQTLKKAYENLLPVDKFIHSKMMKLFSYYIVIGGMPQVVQNYIDTLDMGKVVENQNAIIDLYKLDISKYDNINKGKIQNIFNAIPAELNNKNKRFKLQNLSKTARMERYESGFNWLSDAGVALPCYNIREVKQPLAVNGTRNLFKFFASDCGLLCAMCSSDIQYQIVNDNLDINNGSILENVVACNLKANGFNLYYYDKNKVGEVDFIVEQDSKILPIEVKSGNDYKKHKALNNLLNIDEYKLNEAIVFSKGNVEKINKITYLPFYMLIFFKKSTKLNDMKLDIKF